MTRTTHDCVGPECQRLGEFPNSTQLRAAGFNPTVLRQDGDNSQAHLMFSGAGWRAKIPGWRHPVQGLSRPARCGRGRPMARLSGRVWAALSDQHLRNKDTEAFFDPLHVCPPRIGPGASTRTVTISVSWYCWWRTEDARCRNSRSETSCSTRSSAVCSPSSAIRS